DARLSRDFEQIRELLFPEDKRRLMDMRRSGAMEAIAGGADAIGLSAKLANSIGRSNALHKTYAPVDIEAVRNTDKARLQGRRKMRYGNESGASVSTQQPRSVSTPGVSGAKPLKSLERVKGIEPSSSAWKAVALPLSYTRVGNRSLLTGRQRSAIRIDTKFLLSSTDC